MKTPVCDFIEDYVSRHVTRFHMPGHKGVPLLGPEPWDLTEIDGADALYEADGILAQSEANATALFGTGRTFYSAEGSSQCIRAMLYLALQHRPRGSAPLIVAARNVHKAFVYGAALLDFEIHWLWPEQDSPSICGCPITCQTLDKTLSDLPQRPAAVYVTSPDYLGGVADVAGLAEVCHRHGTRLLVDNAHGAYLHFLQPSRHPMDLGADLCCDSAHKTLPALTGAAYLHLSPAAAAIMAPDAKAALCLFGSTSPSYLILASLDKVNGYLAEGYEKKLADTLALVQDVRWQLRQHGWQVEDTDPLRLTILAPGGKTGTELAAYLRQHRMECEYADPACVVLMLTPENNPQDLHKLVDVLGECPGSAPRSPLVPARCPRRCSVRQALFAPHTLIPAAEALGRICGAPTVACPPAIPIAVSGEEITADALALFAHYGVETVDVLR